MIQHSHPVLSPTFDERVTNLIKASLDDWKTDFCFLYYYAFEKAHLEIASTMPHLNLIRRQGKRSKALLDRLGLEYHTQSKGEVTVNQPA